MHDNMHQQVLELSMHHGIIRRVTAYSFWALSGVLSLCVLLKVNVPWVFVAPSVFAFVTLVLFVTPFFLLSITGESYLVFKLALFGFYFVILLIFPTIFGFIRQGDSVFYVLGFGPYQLILWLIGLFTFNQASLVFFKRGLSTFFAVIIFLGLNLFTQWYFYPDTLMREYKILAVIMLIGTLLGLLQAWLRHE